MEFIDDIFRRVYTHVAWSDYQGQCIIIHINKQTQQAAILGASAFQVSLGRMRERFMLQ